MAIYYIPKSVLGEFIYNSNTHEGISIREMGRAPMVVGMDPAYDPSRHPGCIELKVDEAIFVSLKDLASKSFIAEARSNHALLICKGSLRKFNKAREKLVPRPPSSKG